MAGLITNLIIGLGVVVRTSRAGVALSLVGLVVVVVVGRVPASLVGPGEEAERARRLFGVEEEQVTASRNLGKVDKIAEIPPPGKTPRSTRPLGWGVKDRRLQRRERLQLNGKRQATLIFP